MADVSRNWDAEVVRAQLQRVLASEDFDASDRNRRFLAYVIEEALAGRAERIKAFSIATSVFGRDARFDPQVDPIVRIEARRLRRSLERYYLKAGRDDAVVISIPTGSYVPMVAVREMEPPKVATAPVLSRRKQGPSILVTAFEDEGEIPAPVSFVRGLARQIIVGLTRFSGLFVFGPETTFRYGSEQVDPKTLAKLDVDFILSGGVALAPDRFGIDILLTDAHSGRHIWGESFRRALTPTDIIAMRDEVASDIARFLAQPYGVIFSARASEVDGKPPSEMTSYDCVLQFLNYSRSYERDELRSLYTRLEAVVAAEPHYAEAAACLSLACSDVCRFNYDIPIVGGDPLKRAIDLGKRAISLAPYESRGYQALGLALWFVPDVHGSLATLRHGHALNPNHAEIMGDLGLRYALLADWERAVPLLKESFARNPAQPGGNRIGLALFHFAHGRFDEALAEAHQVEAPNVLYGHIVVAMTAVRAGQRKLAEEAIAKILAIDPDYGRHIHADLGRRSLDPGLLTEIIAALRLAGLEIPDR